MDRKCRCNARRKVEATQQPAIQSCTCTTAVAYWGPSSAGGGGGTAADGAGVQGRGEIDIARVEFLELQASIGLRLQQGRGPPYPPWPCPPSRPPRRPGLPPPRPRQGRVTGIVICSTAADLCFLSSQNSSRRNQYKITKWKGLLHFWCKKPFQRCKNFNCSVICSISLSLLLQVSAKRVL